MFELACWMWHGFCFGRWISSSFWTPALMPKPRQVFLCCSKVCIGLGTAFLTSGSWCWEATIWRSQGSNGLLSKRSADVFSFFCFFWALLIARALTSLHQPSVTQSLSCCLSHTLPGTPTRSFLNLLNEQTLHVGLAGFLIRNGCFVSFVWSRS